MNYNFYSVEIINLLEPTFEEDSKDGNNIRWESSAEIDKMISESRTGSRPVQSKKTEIPMENGEDNKSDVATKKNVENFQFSFLEPNNFVCTTAVKAYGRKMDVNKALAVLPWMENKGLEADTYLLSSLLFVCAKTKRVAEAESIFWHKIPARNLTYSVATTNSLMYMYAKLNRPDDALKVYELAKGTYKCVYLCNVDVCMYRCMYVHVCMLLLTFFLYFHCLFQT